MCAGKNDGPERGGEEEGGGDGDRDKEGAWRGGWHAQTLLFRQLCHQSEPTQVPCTKEEEKTSSPFPQICRLQEKAPHGGGGGGGQGGVEEVEGGLSGRGDGAVGYFDHKYAFKQHKVNLLLLSFQGWRHRCIHVNFESRNKQTFFLDFKQQKK